MVQMPYGPERGRTDPTIGGYQFDDIKTSKAVLLKITFDITSQELGKADARLP